MTVLQIYQSQPAGEGYAKIWFNVMDYALKNGLTMQQILAEAGITKISRDELIFESKEHLSLFVLKWS